MADRPILFSAPMVRALLDGTKTQTRRPLRKDTWWTGEHGVIRMAPAGLGCTGFTEVPCPYGKPGGRLWVRETWAHDAQSLEQCRAAHEDALGGGITYGPYYRATEVAPDTLHWRPSIHMPRWASRITLEVTGVRVERLNDISGTDAQAEGITFSKSLMGWHVEDGTHFHCHDPRQSYLSLWKAINGAGSVEANPWVWVVEFRRAA